MANWKKSCEEQLIKQFYKLVNVNVICNNSGDALILWSVFCLQAFVCVVEIIQDYKRMLYGLIYKLSSDTSHIKIVLRKVFNTLAIKTSLSHCMGIIIFIIFFLLLTRRACKVHSKPRFNPRWGLSRTNAGFNITNRSMAQGQQKILLGKLIAQLLTHLDQWRCFHWPIYPWRELTEMIDWKYKCDLNAKKNNVFSCFDFHLFIYPTTFILNLYLQLFFLLSSSFSCVI